LNGTSSVDPHFARLLSALTLSATTNGTGDGKSDCVPPASAAIPPFSVSSATVADATLNGSAAMGGSYSLPPSKQSMAVPVNDTYQVRNPSSWSGVSSPQPPSQSTITPGSVNSQSPSSKSPTHSRQSSMITADLSPYLARPAGIPMNGKRLKQLALLEAVAHESSRMTLASATGPVMQSPSPRGASPATMHAAPLPNTVMSHNFTNLSPMYSNTHGPYVPPPHSGPLNSPSPDNAFVVRPRTSNSFRPLPNPSPRTFNTRGSMNQAQLLNAVSGTPYPYHSTPSLHRPPIPSMQNFHNPNSFPIPTLMTGAPTFRTGPHPSAFGRVPPPPLPVLSSQTVSGPAAVQVPLSTP
jgi:mRNA-decapping enzyme subunit 2